MRHLLLLCALVVLTPSGAAQPRHDGVFAYPGSTGGCTVHYATTRAVSAYAEPRAVGSPIRQVAAGRRIEGNDRSAELVVVRTPGRLVARRDVPVLEWGYHASDRQPRGNLVIPRGTAIEVLGTVGEASAIWRMNGTAYVSWGIPAAAWMVVEEHRAEFRIESLPVVEQWVRLVPRGGQPAAWLNVTGPGVRKTGTDPTSGPDC